VRALACPDKFRGSLTCRQAATHIASGLAEAGIVDVEQVPMADGGEGTLEAVLSTAGSRRHFVDTVDALGRPLRSPWGMLADGTAVVEAATSIGLAVLGQRRDPVGADSTGLGQVLEQVLTQRPRRLLVAVGGVATTDGGLGCLNALGWDLRGVPTVVACDVTTAFTDAARVFGPQKGADPDQVAELTERLERLATRYAERAADVRDLPGAGAAGGLAGGLAVLGATLRPGFGLVADMVALPTLVAAADLVVTGEGRLDATSLQGKVVGGVLGLPRPARARAAVLAGVVEPALADLLRSRGTFVGSVRELATDEQDSFDRAGTLLTAAARLAGLAVSGC
jgi:glycerate 2-kinase